jgi:hypothetical protein
VTPARLRELLGRVARGELDAEAAIEELSTLPFSEVESALVDSHREIRTGIPEVVFGQGKTPEQTIGIVRALRANGQSALVTRVAPGVATILCAELADAEYDTRAPRVALGTTARVADRRRPGGGRLRGDRRWSGGRQAAATLAFLGVEPVRIEDVGVPVCRLLPTFPASARRPRRSSSPGWRERAERGQRPRRFPGHRSAHQRRYGTSYGGGIAGDDELVRGRGDRGQHRQWFGAAVARRVSHAPLPRAASRESASVTADNSREQSATNATSARLVHQCRQRQREGSAA